MIVVAYCEYHEDLRWLSLLLSSGSWLEAHTHEPVDHGYVATEQLVDGPAAGAGMRIAA